MIKLVAGDGTVEWVIEESKARFEAEGAKCLVWKNLPEVSAPREPDGDDGDGSSMLQSAANLVESEEADGAISSKIPSALSAPLGQRMATSALGQRVTSALGL